MLVDLNQHNLPATDLRMAMLRMRALREAMRKGDGEGIRQAYDSAVRHVRASKVAILRRLEQREALNAEENTRRNYMARETLTELKGYEEMIGEYFKKLAEDRGE